MPDLFEAVTPEGHWSVLEQRHLDAAIRIGIQFAENYPAFRKRDQKKVSADLTLAVNQELNDLALAHGQNLYGTDDFDDEQLRKLRPYLAALAAVVQAEASEGLKIRLAQSKARRPASPGLSLLALRDRDVRDQAGLPPLPRDLIVRGPRPKAMPLGVSHQGAEELVAIWMRHLGALDATTTRFSQDGGIDVESRAYVAQVKNYVGTVGVDAVRSIFGVATARAKRALLFTSGDFTKEALRFADGAGVGLFIYNAQMATVQGRTSLSIQLVSQGL